MNWKHSIFWSFCVLLVLLVRCNTNKPLSSQKKNFNRLYAKEGIQLNAQYQVFNLTADSTELYFKLNSKYLLYNRNDASTQFRARFQFHVVAKTPTSIVLDTTTQVYSDPGTNDNHHHILGKIMLPLKFGHRYQLKIRCTDLNKRLTEAKVIYADKQQRNARENFLFTEPDQTCIFTSYATRLDSICLRLTEDAKDTAFLKFISNNTLLPPPPFVSKLPIVLKPQVDSLRTIFKEKTRALCLRLPETGLLYVQADSSKAEGQALLITAEKFPHITRPEEMLKPLRYLCTKEEFAEFQEEASAKMALDKFWLKKGGSKERAKELIKAFYARVELSNENFTSFVEGWRTDRGLIHIIFGAPSSIYKENSQEYWIYGDQYSNQSYTFVFDKKKHALSNNHYILRRDIRFKPFWFQAVESWRNGRIYTVR